MPLTLVVVAAVVVLAVVVGGLLSVGRASGGYRRAVNRSYVAQARAVVARSNATGAELRRLMASMTAFRRQALRRELASLGAASSQEASAASALAPPTPTVGGFDQAMALRARGVAEVASAVDGVLGLAGDGRATVPVGRASTEVAGAGTLLLRADRDYAAVRRAFLAAPGSARLPRSVWVTDASGWTPGPVQALVQALTLTPGLSGTPDVVVRTGTVHVVPTVVPPVQPGATPVVLPTHHLQVAAVVADQGNLGVPAVTVTAAVVPRGPGRADRSTVTVPVPAGGSVAVTFPPLSVDPGDTYTLSVAVTPPAGQVDRSGTRAGYTLRIALPTPPTTTTTTTAPTSTTRPGRS